MNATKNFTTDKFSFEKPETETHKNQCDNPLHHRLTADGFFASDTVTATPNETEIIMTGNNKSLCLRDKRNLNKLA